MKRGTLCLAMLVAGYDRKEFDDLVKTFNSVVDHIDHWVILMISRCNNELEGLIRDYFKDRDIPGSIEYKQHRFTSVEFPRAKTKLLQMAKGTAEYILIMDRGEILTVTNPIFRLELCDLSYLVEYMWTTSNMPFSVRQIRLVKSGVDWKYIGLPEYITLDGSLPESKKIRGIALERVAQ